MYKEHRQLLFLIPFQAILSVFLKIIAILEDEIKYVLESTVKPQSAMGN